MARSSTRPHAWPSDEASQSAGVRGRHIGRLPAVERPQAGDGLTIGVTELGRRHEEEIPYR